MIFADYGEGRRAPGVAPANNAMRRQANGMLSYGTGAGLLPALPSNYAAVLESNLGDDVSAVKVPMPATALVPIRSTTLPSTMTTYAPITTRAPSMQTAPSPSPESLFPGITSVGTAVASGAAKVGTAAGGATASRGLSRGAMIGIGLLAAAAAATGLVIVWKHR